MNRPLKIPPYVLLVFLFLLFHRAESATVKGRVLNSRSSGPVGNVNVILVGTTFGKVTDSQGAFAIEDVPVGQYTLRAGLAGSRQKEMNIAVDSTSQILEVTVLLRVAGQALVPGCIPEFTAYQSDLAHYLTTHPSALSFEISDFGTVDSAAGASVILSVTNNASYDIYLLKDRGYCRQMYVQKFVDASSKRMPSVGRILYNNLGEPCLHDLGDVVRVPKNEKVVVDTIKLWQYDITRFSSGDYKLQLVYVFPQSRVIQDDLKYGLSSPIANEQGVGELYCMTLQGRFESNWLPVHIK